MEAHYNYQKEYSGKRIYNNVDVNRVYDILFEINSTSKGTWKINGSRAGFGLGAVQWTFGRTYTLVQLYLQFNGGGASITSEQLYRRKPG